MGTLLPRVVALLVTTALVAGPATAAPATTDAGTDAGTDATTSLVGETDSTRRATPPATPPGPDCEPVVDELVAGEDALEALGDDLEAVARRHRLVPAALEEALEHDDELHVEPCGQLLYVERFEAPDDHGDDDHDDHDDHGAAAVLGSGSGDAGIEVGATSQDVFTLHSRPGATRVVYLDVDGHTLSNTFWNTSSPFFLPTGTVLPPFDRDGKPGSFSTAERELIRQIWARVAEDFAPFDVDVTTEEPHPDALTRSSASDDTFGVRVVLTPDQRLIDVCRCAGIATVGTFDRTSNHAHTQVALVLPGAHTSVQFMAMAVSHEVGHTLSLLHHGVTGGPGYYSGHGAWAPIMGSSSRQLEQWSRGEYAGADNAAQDDVARIAARGMPVRADDHGDTPATATSVAPGAVVAGVIERRTDRDVFAFTSPGGAVPVSVLTASTGPNLDVRATVTDASGAVLATLDPPLGSLAAGRLTGLDAVGSPNLPSGTLFLQVEGTGFGSPLTTGYSDYGSLGAYTVTVGGDTAVLEPATLPTFAVGVAASTQVRLSGASGPATFAITAGSLPAGLSLRADGTLSGTPTTAGSIDVTVSATDGAGTVRSRSYTTTVTGPATPVTTAHVAPRTGGVLRVTWTAPTTTALAPRTGYRVHVNGSLASTVSAATTQLDLAGLPPGVAHTIEVRAVNASGHVAGPVVSSVPVVAPTSPSSLTTTRGDRSIAASWPAVTTTAAAPVSGYRVFVDGTQVHEGTGRSHTLTGLTAGRAYVVAVRAYGPGGASTTRSRTVTAVTTPATPTSLTVTRRDRSLALSWPAVPSTTAAPVTGYRVLVDGRQVHQGSGRSHTVTGLSAGTRYTVSVVAYGPGGVSSRRSSSHTAITVPNAQGTVRVTPRSTSASVSWNGVTSTTARPVTGYDVLVGGRRVASVSAGTRSHTVTGLARATTYTIAVRPTNTAGSGRATSLTTTTLR